MWAPGHFAPMKVTHFYIPSDKIVITKLENYFIERDKQILAELDRELNKPSNSTKIEKIEIEQSSLENIINEFSMLQAAERELEEKRKRFNNFCGVVFGELETKYRLTEEGKNVFTCILRNESLP
ncbi:MAG: hypothetical protein QXP04_00885, partial [Candidatus Nanoarchaeia archaeon]|nr:hypothetical protein [Candidatus Jingweiarchaeum tengchongense]